MRHDEEKIRKETSGKENQEEGGSRPGEKGKANYQHRTEKEVTRMKLSEYKAAFYTHSGKASDSARAAAFAGIAIIWVFKIDAKPAPQLPNELLLPTGLFALGLALDLFHYMTATIIWYLFHRYQEKKLPNPADDPELSHSPWLAYPLTVLFGLKLMSVMAGYGFVVRYVIDIWSSGNP